MDKKQVTGPVKKDLNQIVLDVEFLLISVVQGVALVSLAESAAEPLMSGKFEYFLYIYSSFLLILTFWSQAIIHALSFIDWPLSIEHGFLYFLVSFIEVLAFKEVSSPLHWFGIVTLFFIAASVLYQVDSKIIKNREKKFIKAEEAKKLYNHILTRQFFESRVMVPIGLIYSLIAFLLIYKFASLFIDKHFHILLVVVNAIFATLVLKSSLNSFRKRSELIDQAFR